VTVKACNWHFLINLVDFPAISAYNHQRQVGAAFFEYNIKMDYMSRSEQQARNKIFTIRKTTMSSRAQSRDPQDTIAVGDSTT
jgi:hypothetical protein